MKKLRLIASATLVGSAALCLASCSPKLDQSVSVDCSALAFTTEIDAFWTDEAHKTCGHQDAEGMLHISLETMKFFPSNYFEHDYGGWGQKGLSCQSLRLSDGTGGFSYISPDGRARVSNYPYDNNCQPFRNGVAIGYVDGKAIFFDKNLDVVRATEYELADPFYKHLAKVCRIAPEKKYHGEHFKWVGGKCGYIDTEFNEVVPILTPYEDTRRLTGGKYDGVELDEWDTPVLEFLVSHMDASIKQVEAVFRPDGCQLHYCSDAKKAKLDLPANLDEKKTWMKTMRFRLEDQTLWEGLVLSDRQRNLTFHSLKPIDNLPAR